MDHPRTRVLLAEDDVWMRSMVASRLRIDGFDVFEAANGDDVRLLLETVKDYGWPFEDVDLLVMDIRMPGSSGLDVACELRASTSVPILLMTAFPDPDIRMLADRLGVPVLAKPFTLERFAEAVIDAIVDRMPTTNA